MANPNQAAQNKGVPFKQVNADDNPPEKQAATEKQKADERSKLSGAQARRDDAQVRSDQAKIAGAQGGASAEMKASEAQQGRGPAGQNTGPSNTVASDPHNPPGVPTRANPTGAISPASQGMGQSPPQGERVTTDKRDEDFKLPGELPGATPAQQAEAKQQREDMARAKQQGDQARDDLRQAGEDIRNSQSPGENDPSKRHPLT